MKKSLPFVVNPPITAYQYHAFGLGILFTHDSFINYFACNYINLSYVKRGLPHGLDIPTTTFFERMDCFIKNVVINDSGPLLFDYTYTPDKLFDIIMFMIDNNYYLHGKMNSYYLPNRNNYKINYGTMDYLIYGYDPNKKILKSSGYNKDGIYEEFWINHLDLFNGISSLESSNWFEFLKFKDNYFFEFNLDGLKNLLYDYLNSKFSYSYFVDDYIATEDNSIWGLKVYDELVSDINSIPNKLGYMRIIWEHKKCMEIRLKYLINNKYLGDDSIIYEYTKITENFSKIFSLTIKNQFVSSENITKRVVDHIKISAEKEFQILSKVLNLL